MEYGWRPVTPRSAKWQLGDCVDIEEVVLQEAQQLQHA